MATLASNAGGYVWEDPGDSIMIQLNLDVIDRLAAVLQPALEGQRSAEIGGILLGLQPAEGGRTVVIEDFELFPSEYVRGASYTLSPRERHALGNHLARRRTRQVVGFFRSHTRPGMYLDQDDFAVFSSYFGEPAQVFLLVKPALTGPATGGFFFWEDGDVNRRAPYRQFPFDSATLIAGNHSITGLPAAVPPARPAPVPSTRPVPVPSTRPAHVAIDRPAVPAVRGTRPIPTHPVVKLDSLKLPSVRLPQPPSVRLPQLPSFRLPQVPWLVVPIIAAVILIASLIVSGKRSAKSPPSPQPVTRAARKATPPAPAEPPSLNTPGTENSAPAQPERNIAERVQLDEEAQPGVPALSSAPMSADAPTVKLNSKRHDTRQPAAVYPVAPAHVAKAKPAVREFEAPPSLGAPGPVTATARPLEGMFALPHPDTPQVEITSAGAHHSGIGHVFHKIARFGEGDSDSFVPPAPVHKVRPAVPAGTEEGPVDVKVLVDENGNVAHAQVLTKHTPLAGPLLDAARQWHFTPARKKDKPVASEVVLHFRFGGQT